VSRSSHRWPLLNRSSDQTTLPPDCGEAYQFHCWLSVATRNSPRPPSSASGGVPSSPRPGRIGGRVRPDPDAAERRVAARMARQELFTRPEPPEIWAVLDESVILRPVGGPAVMAAQLRHLIEVSTRPNAMVTVQILPLAAGAHPGMSGPFVILNFQNPKDPPMVHLETATDGLYLEEPPDIERYTLRFSHLVARALGPNESRAMITDLAQRMT